MKKTHLEYLRVLSIIGVLTIHVTAGYFNKFGQVPETTWWVANILNAFSRFCVPMFIMISGALLLGKEIKLVTFYRKKLKRVGVPLIFWNIFYFVLLWCLTGDFYEVVRNSVRLGCTYYHLWFLSMFMVLMLFVPILNRIICRGEISLLEFRITSLITFSLLLASFVFKVLGLIFDTIYFPWIGEIPFYIGYLFCGYFLEQVWSKKINRLVALGAILVLTIIGIVLNYVLAKKFDLVKDSFVLDNSGILVACICVLLFLFFKELPATSNLIVRNLSNASFGIYLIHPFWMLIFGKIFSNATEYGLVYMPANLFFTLALSYLSVIIINKTPYLKLVC